MIRINLLEETRTQGKAAGGGISMPDIQVAENVPVVILAGAALLAIGIVAATWFWYAGVISDLDDKIAVAEKEKKRLEHVLKRNDELQAKRADLERKIDVIGDLKQNQDVPVQMLDHVSQNLADHVWLNDLSFTPDKHLTLQGLAQTPLAVANFIRNLEESSWFQQVQMGQVSNTREDLTKFRIDAVFTPPQPEGAATGTAEGAR